jgi:hypothetical protein
VNMAPCRDNAHRTDEGWNECLIQMLTHTHHPLKMDSVRTMN